MAAPDSSRTWTAWVESLFIPKGTENEEEYRFQHDPTVEHDGIRYQLSAEEEETEQLYKRQLASAALDNFEDIAACRFLRLAGSDRQGRPVVIVVARNLPAIDVDAERMFQYVITTLDAVVEAHRSFCVVYVHTESSSWQNSPGALWLRGAYERLALKYKRRLHKFYILHSDMSLWLTMSVLCPFMSHGFWSKVSFVSRVEFLWEFLDEKKIMPHLPAFVKAHDAILEDEPLHDYGFVSVQDREIPMATNPPGGML